MDVFEAIRTVLAVRRYQDKPVPEAKVRRIVEAGRLTGSAKNVQPWRFLVVRDRWRDEARIPGVNRLNGTATALEPEPVLHPQ